MMKTHIIGIIIFAASVSVSSACKTPHANMPGWTRAALAVIGAKYGDDVRKYLIGKQKIYVKPNTN